MGVLIDEVPRPVERDGEQAAIASLLELAAGGSGGALAFEADAGLGKTTLLELSFDAARERGFACASARGSELERDLPLGVIRQLLEPVVLRSSADEQEQLFAGAAALAQPLLTGGWAPSSASADPALPVLHGLYWVVAGLAERGPLLLALDDLQWADAGSLRFLRFLLARVRELPVALALATRPAAVPGTPPDLPQLLVDPAVRVVRPAPLSAAAVGAVVAHVLEAPEPAFARACLDATGGIPFHVHELARELAERGVPPVDARAGDVAMIAPRNVGDSLRARLAALPAAATDVAGAVAVLGDAAEVRHVAELAGVSVQATAGAAGQLVRAGVLADARPLRFVHPIVRAAVDALHTEPERAAAHLVAARLLARERSLEAAAAHLVLAERTGDAEAVDVLLHAAEQATGRGAPETAVRLLRRAVEEPPPPDRRSQVLTALGRAELTTAEATSVDHLRAALDLAAEPRERVDIAITLARALAHTRSMDAGATLIDDERQELAGIDHDLALELEAEFAALAWFNLANVPPADRLEHYATLAGTTRPERALLAVVSRTWAHLGRPASECATLARRALAGATLLGPDGLGLLVWLQALAVLAAADDVSAVDQALADALTETRTAVAPFEFYMVSLNAATVALDRGDVAGAEATARGAEAVGREHGFVRRFRPEGALLGVLLARGRVQDAEDMLLERGLAGELPEGLITHDLRVRRARLRLAEGRPAEALADLRTCARVEAALGMPAGPSTELPLMAMALREQDPATARALAEEGLAVAQRWGVCSAIGVAKHALGLVVGGQDGIDLLRQGVETLAGTPRRLAHAQALVDLGAALRRAGQRRAARDALREGADRAQRCDATGIVERALAELAATGARPRRVMLSGVASLTPMERRIAALAAEGLSNPGIAQALFVTVKNVEMHLTRAYRKLDISSRAQLPAALAADGDAGATTVPEGHR